jgi:hypothetical protein
MAGIDAWGPTFVLQCFRSLRGAAPPGDELETSMWLQEMDWEWFEQVVRVPRMGEELVR